MAASFNSQEKAGVPHPFDGDSDELAVIRKQLAPEVEGIIGSLVSSAKKGSARAAKLCLAYWIPPSTLSQTRVRGLDALCKLAPDQRIQAIQHAVLKGKVSVEMAQVLTDMASKEVESGIASTVRDLTARLKRGEGFDSIVADLKRIDIPELKPPVNLLQEQHKPRPLIPALREALGEQ